MQNQQIIDYINEQLKLGVPQGTIKTALMQNGWLPSDVDAAFATLSPVQVSNLVPPIQPVGQQPNQTINTGSQVMYGNPSPKGHGKIVVSIVSVLIFLGISAGAVWAYMNFVSPDPQQTVNKSMSKLVDAIEKGYLDNTATVEINGEGTVPEAGNVKVDFNGSANVKSDIKDGKSSGSISMNVKATLMGMNFNVDEAGFIDVFVSNGALFVRLNKIPSGAEVFTRSMQPQVDFVNKEIVGKWIKIDQEQLAKLQQYNSSGVSSSLSYANSINASTTELILKALASSNIYDVVQTLPSDTVDGKSVFHYKIAFNKDGLTNFMLAYASSTSQIVINDAVKVSARKVIDDMFSKLDQMGFKLDMDIWVERYSKLPVKFTIGMDVSNAPEIQAMGWRKFAMIFGTTYAFPSTLNLVEPESSVNFTDILNSLSNSGLLATPSPASTVSDSQGANTSTAISKANANNSSYNWRTVGYSGPLSVSMAGSVTLKNENVTQDLAPQTSNIFVAGKKYIIHLNGIDGFTTFHKNGTSTIFVNVNESVAIYDGTGSVVYNNDSLSPDIGGEPKSDSQDIITYITLPADITTGNYKWVFLMTDRKDSKNALKAEVNFKIK